MDHVEPDLRIRLLHVVSGPPHSLAAVRVAGDDPCDYVAGYAVLAVSWIEADVENTALMIATDVLSCLPVWLLGCWLVEVVSTGRKLVFDHLAVWRCVIVLASLTIGLLHYRGVVGLELTGPIYGAVAVPWLWAEISHDRNYPVVTKWGQWSYSLYLVHPAAFFGSRPLLVALHVPGPLLTPVGILVALVCAYLFYLAVERPSHRLARALSARCNGSPLDSLPSTMPAFSGTFISDGCAFERRYGKPPTDAASALARYCRAVEKNGRRVDGG